MARRLTISTVFLPLFVAATNAASAADLTGVWLTGDRDAQVRFAPCGSSICGTVVWLKDPIDSETGKPLTDKKNPDPARRRRPVIGLPIAIGFKDSGDGTWVGTFYNSDDGHSYKGNIVRSGPNTLSATGCLLMFCQTQTWTRVGG